MAGDKCLSFGQSPEPQSPILEALHDLQVTGCI